MQEAERSDRKWDAWKNREKKNVNFVYNESGIIIYIVQEAKYNHESEQYGGHDSCGRKRFPPV